MSKAICTLCLFAAAVLPASAGSILFQGIYSQDDEVALLPFTISATGTVTIESYGYAGGTAPGQTVISNGGIGTDPGGIATIPAGGFAPYAVLFDSNGNEISGDNGGHCGTTGTDPITGNCDDPVLVDTLGPGTYTIALSVWDNTPVDGFLPDGYNQTGNPGFTCAEFGFQGEFCDTTTATGVARDGNYAISVTASNLVIPTAPEPSTFVLISFAAGFVSILRRRAIR